jgi:hypothetical protein
MTTPRASAIDPGGSDSRSRFGLAGTSGHRDAKFGVVGAVVGALVATVLVGGLVWSAATGQAPPSQRPQIFGGSLVLDDYRPLTVIDLATGAVTVQLEGVNTQVGTTNYADVEAVGTTAGTMLVNRATGTFNMLGKDNYVLGPSASGISLGPLAGSTGATGLADGAAAYVVRYAPDSTVSLVDSATAEAGAAALASGSHHSVPPVGFAQVRGAVDSQPGGATVNGGDLWVLETPVAGGCGVVQVAQSDRATHGLATTYGLSTAIPCRRQALETAAGTVGLALPGRVVMLGPAGGRKTVAVNTAGASEFLPVQGADGDLWFLARMPSGWSVFGVSSTGAAIGPWALSPFGPASDPAVPAYSAGLLYTLDQVQSGQPTLWTIDPKTGVVKPVPGVGTYPARSITEEASFAGAQVLVDGPRVVFNNPESLLAVVVFTDGSHAPVIVDKSTAVVVSAAGPGDVNVKARKHKAMAKPKSKPQSHPNGPEPTTTPTTVAQPLTQPVTQQVDCATTTEKPYEPQISAISPADESALVVWTYHLLSEQDCLPSTWSVTVTALDGGGQPAHPLQVVNGQQQFLFTGLTPGTTYQAVVTAYMNKESTASTPVSFTTTAVGPGSPRSVTAVADGVGGWVVSWTPCSQACEVAARTWSITGSSCGPGFVGQPPDLTVPGNVTSVTINAGNRLGLLGESFEFSVQGISTTGLVGAPSADTRCTQAWQPPDPADLQLLAAGTPVGQTITAGLNLVVAPGTPSVVAYGGDPVTITYALAGQRIGPTTSVTANVAGLNPAQLYQASVVVTPVGHPSAAVTVRSAQFGRTLPWPSGVTMQAAANIGANANSGLAVATFQGLPPGPFQAQGTVTCGSEVLPAEGDLSGAQFVVGLNLDQIGGHCTMSLVLRSRLLPDPYGLPSPALSAPLTIGVPPVYHFAAKAGDTCAGQCSTLDLYVTFTGKGQPAGTDWQVSASSSPGCSSAGEVRSAAGFPVVLQWPITCSTPTVTVSWVYLGQPTSTTASLPRLPVATSTTTAAPTTVATTTMAAPTTVAPTTVATTTTAAPTTVAITTTTVAITTTTVATVPTTVPTMPRTPPPAATTTVPVTHLSPPSTAPTTTTTLPTTTATVPPTTVATTTTLTVPASTTTNPCPDTTVVVTGGPTICVNGPTTTSTTTTTLPTTTSSTLPTTTAPAATTTVPTTTPTTTTTGDTTPSVSLPCLPPDPECSAPMVLSAAIGGSSGAPPPSAPPTVALWSTLAATLAGVCAAASSWCARRARRSRLRTYLTLEATS